MSADLEAGSIGGDAMLVVVMASSKSQGGKPLHEM
jgi:hypothetical protein